MFTGYLGISQLGTDGLALQTDG